jgi:PEP-CTERM motif
MKALFVTAAVGALALSAAPAFAFTQIVQPDAAYTSSTTDLGGGDGSFGSITSLSDGTMTVGFSSGLAEYSVPTSWATWNSPSATESSTPNVLFTQGAQSLTLSLSTLAKTFGFELEPDLFQTDEVTAGFYKGGNLIGSLDLFPNGSAGALLFAASDAGGFDQVVINDLSGDDFAIAQVRYGFTAGVPEPGVWAMMLLGLGAMGATLRSRRQAALAA